MVLFVVDVSTGEFEEDIKILDKIRNKKMIVIGNKIDNADKKAMDSFRTLLEKMTKVEISALYDRGVEELRQTIYNAATGQKTDEFTELVLSNTRHKISLEQARDAIMKAEETLKEGLSKEFIAVELKEAVERFGEITGIVTTEDILDRIFSQFCIGK